mmetsp:Transcript_24127/g.48868  ORF Transcript_24127/g.48868 Transcript_24127/m.48868 type:complete len:99 (-) Transcript_24127:2122-2418(-)
MYLCYDWSSDVVGQVLYKPIGVLLTSKSTERKVLMNNSEPMHYDLKMKHQITHEVHGHNLCQSTLQPSNCTVTAAAVGGKEENEVNLSPLGKQTKDLT